MDPKPLNQKVYFIHDNGTKPFRIQILNDRFVDIHAYTDDNQYTNLLLSLEAEKIFIGKSHKTPMTDFSGGYGEKFDGNSILLYEGSNEYLYIGSEIFRFRSETTIVEFVSHIGNNDVPYPFAIDEEDNYYFMLEYAILKVDSHSSDDPYRFYYDKIKDLSHYANIEHMIIENEEYNVNSNPNPTYNYEDLTKRLGNPIYMKRKGYLEIEEITKEEFIELLSNFNQSIGLRPMNLLLKPINGRKFLLPIEFENQNSI